MDRRDDSDDTERRIALEMTLRGVDPLDDIVYFVHDCVAGLGSAWGGRGRCVLTVCPRWQARQSIGYEVNVRVVGTDAYAESRRLGRDLFQTLREAFDEVQLRLVRSVSGIRSVARVDERSGSDEPGEAAG